MKNAKENGFIQAVKVKIDNRKFDNKIWILFEDQIFWNILKDSKKSYIFDNNI